MNDHEDILVEEAIRTLADEIPLRDLLDEMIFEMKSMRDQLDRIENKLMQSGKY